MHLAPLLPRGSPGTVDALAEPSPAGAPEINAHKSSRSARTDESIKVRDKTSPHTGRERADSAKPHPAPVQVQLRTRANVGTHPKIQTM